MKTKENSRFRRGLKTKKIQRRDSEKPRIVVFRSNNHIYSQIVITDLKGDKVLVSSSTLETEIKGSLKGSKTEQAHQVGKVLGERAKNKSIETVCFDRSGYKYHGRVKALAEGVREAGLNF